MTTQKEALQTINKIEQEIKTGSGLIVKSQSLKERMKLKFKTAVITGMMVAGIFASSSQKLLAQENNPKVRIEQTSKIINPNEEKKEINIIIKSSKLYSQLITERSLSKEERDKEINKLSEFISKHFEVFCYCFFIFLFDPIIC